MPKVSILLRTRNAGDRFLEVLDAIAVQSVRDLEIVLVDSGSTDDTIPLAESRGARIVSIPPARFTHALSTNLGFEAAQGEFVVSLSQDATPADSRWLERLLEAVTTPDVAAAYGRQVPRPGCFAVERIEIERAYPERVDRSGSAVLFSNVNSIVRRDLWREHRFDEGLTIAEDQEWARWAVARGFRIIYVPEAGVWHSHDYTLRQIYRRCESEGRALAVFAGFHPGIGSIVLGWPKLISEDFATLKRRGELRQWPRSCLFRFAQLLGNYRGARAAS